MKPISELLEARLEQMEPQQEAAMSRMRIRNLLAKVRAKRQKVAA